MSNVKTKEPKVKSFDFIEIDYEECAEIMSSSSPWTPVFYLDGDDIMQIKGAEDFVEAVASQLEVYRQY